MAVQDSAGEEVDWVAFTIRLPRAMHEWLRYQAFFDRTNMSEIVREEVAARMTRSARVAAPAVAYEGAAVAVGEITGPMGIVKP